MRETHRAEIEVKKFSGESERVKASVYGPLAVHRDIASYSKVWVITHVETGAIVRGDFNLKRDAVRFVQMIIGLKWSGDNLREVALRNRDAIQQAYIVYQQQRAGL